MRRPQVGDYVVCYSAKHYGRGGRIKQIDGPMMSVLWEDGTGYTAPACDFEVIER